MIRRIATAVGAALLFSALALVPTAQAAVGSAPPATPQIGGSATSGTDGTIEVARQITQCGDTMYVGGAFTQVRNPGSNTPVARNNVFAFRATSPYTIWANWNPNVNGQVDTVACAPDGGIYIGGQFTTVGGAAVRNLAKVTPATNNGTAVNQPAFTLHPAGRVAHVEVVRDQGGRPAPARRRVRGSLPPVGGPADRGDQNYRPTNLASRAPTSSRASRRTRPASTTCRCTRRPTSRARPR